MGIGVLILLGLIVGEVVALGKLSNQRKRIEKIREKNRLREIA